MLKLLLALSLWTSACIAQPFVGMVAPDFTLNRTTQSGGGQFHLADYLGKVVYLNFFGTTCSYCIANGWVSEDIRDNFSGNSDFVVAGIDVWDAPANIVEFIFRAQAGVSYQLLINGRTTGFAYDMENGGSVANDCEGRGHIILDCQGVIRYYVPYDTLYTNPNLYKQQMMALINNLLVQEQPQDVTIFVLENDCYRLRWSPVPCAANYSILGSFLGDFSDEFWVGETQTHEFMIESLEDSFAVFRVDASNSLLTAPPPDEKKGGG